MDTDKNWETVSCSIKKERKCLGLSGTINYHTCYTLSYEVRWHLCSFPCRLHAVILVTSHSKELYLNNQTTNDFFLDGSQTKADSHLTQLTWEFLDQFCTVLMLSPLQKSENIFWKSLCKCSALNAVHDPDVSVEDCHSKDVKRLPFGGRRKLCCREQKLAAQPKTHLKVHVL